MGLIYGKNPVIEAISSGKTINKIYVAKGSKDVYDIIKMAKDKRIVVVESDKQKLDKMIEQTVSIMQFKIYLIKKKKKTNLLL